MKNTTTLQELKIKLMTDLLATEVCRLVRLMELGEVSKEWAVTEAARRAVELTRLACKA